jgi:hypothetical protein
LRHERLVVDGDPLVEWLWRCGALLEKQAIWTSIHVTITSETSIRLQP